MLSHKKYQEQLARLRMENKREELIRLYREYERCCREEGDLDGLATVLEPLSYELSVSGREEEATDVFCDLFELQKALAQHDFKKYGEAYALLLNRKASSWSRDIDEAIACQEEAIDVYKRLGLYDEKGFDIGYEDAFGFLGRLYCFRGDYEKGIRYTKMALERALDAAENDFLIGVFYRQLCIAYLSLDDTTEARACLLKAQVFFIRSEQADPDPCTFPYITESLRLLMAECDKRTHTDEFYRQWLIG